MFTSLLCGYHKGYVSDYNNLLIKKEGKKVFWMLFLLLFVGLVIIQIVLIKHPINEKQESYEISVGGQESQVVVVDKMIECMHQTNLMKERKNKYVLFIQMDNLRVVELIVSQHVFDHVNTGDHGIVKEMNEGTYNFKKVS